MSRRPWRPGSRSSIRRRLISTASAPHSWIRNWSAKVAPRYAQGGRSTNVGAKEVRMAKQINCECGYVARGEADEEVIALIRDHMRSDHPALLEQVSYKDLRGWIEET